MALQHILVVEDDPNLSKLVTYNLEKAGFHSTPAQSGESGLQHLSTHAIDLIILDIMLPGMDGLAFCKKVKQSDKYRHIPIILLTAKSEEIDRIVGFELGADDYVAKPFSTRELMLRVKAILKRREPREEKQTRLTIDQLTIDIPRHRVVVAQDEIELTHMEFKLLLLLVERKGRVQSRERLLEDVWEVETTVTTRTIDTHVRHLRQKLGLMGKLIETVRGLGYRFSEGEDITCS